MVCKAGEHQFSRVLLLAVFWRWLNGHSHYASWDDSATVYAARIPSEPS